MGLIGNSRELTLVDLVQLKAHGRGTCRIQVQGPHGPGVLWLAGPDVVHAEYAGDVGLSAASALLAEQERIEYWATSDVALPEATMRSDVRTLVFQAAVQLDELRRTARPPRDAAPAAAAVAGPARRGTGRLRTVAGAVAVAAVIGVVALARIEVGPSQAAAVSAAPAPAPEPRRVEPVEASALAGPRDELPVLVAGDPPHTPVPGLALRPTVVVRILVDESGGVASAEVYQPRAGLEEFERAALAAVRKLRFRAALRDGAPVPTWVNWPVDFI